VRIDISVWQVIKIKRPSRNRLKNPNIYFNQEIWSSMWFSTCCNRFQNTPSAVNLCCAIFVFSPRVAKEWERTIPGIVTCASWFRNAQYCHGKPKWTSWRWWYGQSKAVLDSNSMQNAKSAYSPRISLYMAVYVIYSRWRRIYKASPAGSDWKQLNFLSCSFYFLFGGIGF
jgi:hypothetical protein